MYITAPSVELVNVYGYHSSSDLLIIAWVTPISDCYGLINEGPIYMVMGTQENPPPSYPWLVNLSFCHCKIQTTIYINVTKLSQGEITRVHKWSHLGR